MAAISSTDPTLPKLKLTRDSLVQSGGESGPRIGGCVLSHAAASSARPSLQDVNMNKRLHRILITGLFIVLNF